MKMADPTAVRTLLPSPFPPSSEAYVETAVNSAQSLPLNAGRKTLSPLLPSLKSPPYVSHVGPRPQHRGVL